jgi:hypothetical protein
MGLLEVIAAALAKQSVSTGFDYFKGLLSKAGDNAGLRAEILKLQDMFLKMRDENAQLKDLLGKAGETIKKQLEMTFKYGAYFTGLDTKGFIGGPYCKRCWEVDNNCCTLGEEVNLKKEKEWVCAECDRTYPIPSAYRGISIRPAVSIGLAGQITNQNE